METLRFISRALRSRNYRLFFIGQTISLTGTWLQLTALPWLVYRLTSSPLLLGLVGFLSQIPTFLLTPFAGVLIDRMDRRHLLLITQTLSMFQALILWSLLVSHHMSIEAILILSFALGVINAFDIPARQAFVVDMITKKEDLGNAIALNSTTVHAARLIGPAIAGIMIASFGEASCFLLNTVSFLAVITSLLWMKIHTRPQMVAQSGIFRSIKEGFVYVKGNVPMKAIMLLIATVSLTGMPYIIFMPIFAKDVFHGNAYTLGFLLSASGIGAFLGSFYMASRVNMKGFGQLIVAASALFGIGLMGFAFSLNLWLSWACMLIVGFGMMAMFAACNTVLQTIVDDDKRGRVLSLYTICFMGMTPVGSYIQGWFVHKVGVSLTVFIGGSICLLASMSFARSLPLIKDVIKRFREKTAIQTAADPNSPQ